MYAAISSNDQASYMNTISPNSRSVFKWGNVVRSVIISSNFSAFGFGVDFGELLGTSYGAVTATGSMQPDGHVVVRAAGWASFFNYTVSYPMCDLWDVRRYADGQWLVDVEAPERQQRLAALADLRIRTDPTLATLPSILSRPVAEWGQALLPVLQMCDID